MTLDPAELARRIDRAAALLLAGGIIVYPTETFYGLGARASEGCALRRLTEAKLRPEGKPLPLLAADRRQVEAVAILSDPIAQRLADRFWPGPLTLVLPALPALAHEITAGQGTVAIRIPGSDVARALAHQAGGALISTSANLSGEPPPSRVQDLSSTLRSRIDGVLDGGPTPGGLPSTIVRAEAGGVRLLREGAVPFSEILAEARAAGGDLR